MATTMEQRINYSEVAPDGIRALGGLEAYVRSCGLEPGLLELVCLLYTSDAADE